MTLWLVSEYNYLSVSVSVIYTNIIANIIQTFLVKFVIKTEKFQTKNPRLHFVKVHTVRKMSFLDQIYNLSRGAIVEIHLKNMKIRGEFNLVLKGVGFNPEIDQICLERAIELPSGKEQNGSVSILVKDVINFIVFKVDESKGKHEIPTPPHPQSNATSDGKVAKEGKRPGELILRTCVISNEGELKFLMRFLKEIKVCGVSFEGENIGPHGKVAWIVLAAEKTVLPIDVVLLTEQTQDFWQVLDKGLFGNEKLVKIVHDARPMADFLFYKHGIQFMNIVDTQVTDVVIFQTAAERAPIKLHTLSQCLRVNNYRIPEEELELLEMHEKYDFSTNSPMFIRPRPPPIFLKCCAIRVKHLIPLHEHLLKKIILKMAIRTGIRLESCQKESNQV